MAEHALFHRVGREPETIGYIAPALTPGHWAAFRGPEPRDEGWEVFRSRDEALRHIGGRDPGLVAYGRSSFRVIERIR